MKQIKSLLFGSLVLSAAVQSVSAEAFTIRIVASNGDRQATQTALSNILTNWTYKGLSSNNTATSAAAGANNLGNATSSNYGVWTGTITDANNVVDTYTVKVSFAGALAGVAAVAGQTQQRFVFSNGATDVTKSPAAGDAQPGVDYELQKADFGLSTNFQSTSPFVEGTFKGVVYNDIDEEVVGVSPLGFYASPGFPADNITTQQAQLLYTSGTLSVAQFTGDYSVAKNDVNRTVWAIGRNTDAGQRFGAYTEIGLGTSTNVRVWQPSITGQLTYGNNIPYGGTANSHILWPAESFSGIDSQEGSGGFSTGALLSAVLTTTLGPKAYKGTYTVDGIEYDLYPDAVGGYYIGYVTPGDADPRILNVPSNPGKKLKYNGVELTTANVQNGLYTAWLYNRVLRPKTGLTGKKLTFSNLLAARIKGFDATQGGGIKIDNDFKVQRGADGGLVEPRF